jgi:hypothetical protein
MILLGIMILSLIGLIDILGVRNIKKLWKKTLARNTGQKYLWVEDEEITSWSLIYENYSLVLEVWKNCNSILGAKFKILDRIKDEL